MIDSNKHKRSEKSALTGSREGIRDYKSISSSVSTTFNKVESKFERGDGESFGTEVEQKEFPLGDEKAKTKIKRNSSMISLKSINQNLKAMLKITRNDPGSNDTEAAQVLDIAKKKLLSPPIISAPSLKIDDVDIDETKMLLIYPQSPQRYPSSSSVTPAVTPSGSTTPLLQYQEYAPHRLANPSAYLSISISPRRSSTSDILNKKTPSGNAAETPPKKSSQNLQNSGSASALAIDPNVLNTGVKDRRPSTSELLRKARERKGSEGKLGRSISSGGSLAGRSGNRNRRMSMAF